MDENETKEKCNECTKWLLKVTAQKKGIRDFM